MLKIGLISDTHGYLDPTVSTHFQDMDEIWHLGDIGSMGVLEQLQKIKPTRAVFGNIDSPEIRLETSEVLQFTVEGLHVYMIHIGALPPKYTQKLKNILHEEGIHLFLCGHSHILRVIKDPQKPDLVYINPGAAGHHGFHHTRTLMRMHLENGKITHLEVVELGKR
ncbi:MAG: metallophosphoesterase family protein [Leadbetterella sp.]